MLITILVVLVLLGLGLYGVQIARNEGLDRRIAILIQILLIVIAIIYIAQAAGIG